MQRLLITGATGYIGKRLTERLLQEKNIRIQLLVRSPDKLAPLLHDHAEVIQGSTFDPEPLKRSLEDVDSAYYLIHSMSSGKKYQEMDKESAVNFREASIAAGVKRIIYLGGLGQKETSSRHLLSRIETGEILSQKDNDIQTIWFRAAVIIGSGSASFEIIRHLVKKLPIMTTPHWVDTKTQPIGIDDVLAYLVKAKDLTYDRNLIVDIGGDSMSFRCMLETTAKLMKMKRWIIPLRVLTPKLSSYWLRFITHIDFNIARELVEGLKTETLVENDNAQQFFPDIDPLNFTDAVQRALNRSSSP
jgi:uncharacterized protein YbjT (DUF2867 family)